ncbi:MAG: rRNA pseudouridine synthase [Lachnospiraceae bacterium]|nr:rRNA pseudouridine synthase [Lachnospiraceae bacterium]
MSYDAGRNRTTHGPVGIRINKYLASCGICSRREADALIEAGAVTIDGKTALPGDRVTQDNTVKVNGKRVQSASRSVVVAYYKPVGVTCTEKDPHAEKTIRDAFRYPVRLTYAGRLDKDSEGLLLMTNDGDLIHAMMQGAHRHEKEYLVRTRRKISDEELQRLRKGIYLRELEEKTRPCEVLRLGDYTFSIILTQGLNRQIRRMLSAIGQEVKILKRTRVLNVRIGKLKPGEQRTLSDEETRALYEAAGLTWKKQT